MLTFERKGRHRMRSTRYRPLRTTARRGAVRFPALLWLLLAAVLAGCSAISAPSWTVAPVASTPPASPAASGSPSTSAAPTAAPSPTAWATLTDDEGRQVTLRNEPRAIVSLTPAATETLFALGAGDRVVGKVEDFAGYPPAAAAVPDVAKFGSVDVERIVALKADLVIAGGNQFNPPAEIDRLRTLGIPVVVVYAPDLRTALADIELIGAAVGRSAEATRIVGDLRSTLSRVEAAVRGLARPRVFYELDATNGYFGPAPDYFGVEMIRLAGGDPLTSGTPGAFQIPEERIIAFDPEIILLGDAAYGVTAQQVAARSAWGGLTAVRTGAIRPVDDIIITRPGPRLGEGLLALARAIHPGASLPEAIPSAAPGASAAAAAAAGPPDIAFAVALT
jgi:iron complex transport system substrate-binding protein